MQPSNLELIYRYQTHLVEARGLHCKTIDAYLRHILLFAESVGNKTFDALQLNDIVLFKKQVITLGQEEPEPTQLAPRTIVQTLNCLKAFLTWLRTQPGHKRLTAEIVDFCSPTRHLAALARVSNAKHLPTPEELHKVLTSMPDDTFRQRRDRAVLAWLFLTGMRDGAVIGLQMKHVDPRGRRVFQDPRDIRTKFSKNMTTTFFPVGEDIESLALSWLHERQDAATPDDAPLFPSLQQTIGKAGTNKKETFWKTAGPIQKLVRAACQSAGVPSFNPHAIRSTLGLLAFELVHSLEELKAWSQNLGHENLGTTLQYYGTLPGPRQHDLVDAMQNRGTQTDAQRVIDKLNRMNPDQRQAVEIMIDAIDPVNQRSF